MSVFIIRNKRNEEILSRVNTKTSSEVAEISICVGKNIKAQFAVDCVNQAYKVSNLGNESFRVDGANVYPNMHWTVNNGSEVTLGDVVIVVECAEQPPDHQLTPNMDLSDDDDDRTSSLLSALQSKFTQNQTVTDTDHRQTCSESSNKLSIPRWTRILNSQGQLSALVYTSGNVESSHKIAGYDMDGTLITTKSGRKFPTDKADWQFAYPEVPGKLKMMCKSGYKVLIFTNQKGLQIGKITEADLKWKLERIVKALGIPVQTFVSVRDDINRKPAPGMWLHLLHSHNDGVTVDADRSVYVGDAAGRSATASYKKDFSCSDRLFALNIDVPFQTPEEHFLNKKGGEFALLEFDPRTLLTPRPLTTPADVDIARKDDRLDVIVMVGVAGSGKTHFVTSHLIPHGYVHINRDELGSQQRCVKLCEESLQRGHSVVIDNTNIDRASRKIYVDLARRYQAAVRGFIMNVTKPQCLHNNKYRRLVSSPVVGYDDDDDGDCVEMGGAAAVDVDAHKTVGDMIIHSMWSKYERPTAAEGFTQLVDVNFRPHFANSKKKFLYFKFLSGS